MSTADDAKLDERLERALPHLLTYHPYDYQRDVASFRAEEEELDQEIDRVWEEVLDQQAPSVGGNVVVFRRWWGAAAAGVIAAAGLAGVLTLNQFANSPDKAQNTTYALKDPEAVRRIVQGKLQKDWQPTPELAAATSQKAVLGARIAPRPSGSLGVELEILQSSGSAEFDQSAFDAANSKALYKPLQGSIPALGKKFTYTFDPKSGQVSVANVRS